MFVNIIHFPPVKPGKDAEFREWFAWSNELYAQHQGWSIWRTSSAWPARCRAF